MSRIPPLQPPFEGQIAEDMKTIFGDEAPLVLFTTIATSERAWKKFRYSSMLNNSLLSLREREIVIDRTCARTGCEWEWGVHVQRFGKTAGLSEDEIAETLRVPVARNKWSEREAVLIETVDALHERSRLSDKEFAALAAHYDNDQVLEIMQLTGNYHTVSYIASGLALPLAEGAPTFREYEQKL